MMVTKGKKDRNRVGKKEIGPAEEVGSPIRTETSGWKWEQKFFTLDSLNFFFVLIILINVSIKLNPDFK